MDVESSDCLCGRVNYLCVRETGKSAQVMAIAILYDELVSPDWMERSKKAYTTMNEMAKLKFETGKIDNILLEAAKTRLPGVLQTCNDVGSESPAPQRSSGLASSLLDWTTDAKAMHHQSDMLSDMMRNREGADNVCTNECER